MKSHITKDLIKINLDQKFQEISDSDKEKLLTDTNSSFAGEKRGLSIKFELSRAGKLINGRFYNTSAQRDTESWTKPYGKAIITDHVSEEADRVMGRITDVKYISLENEATAWLGSSAAFQDVLSAFDSQDHEKIHKVVNKYKLYSKDWPGLSKLEANARISDPVAVEKFLDQRYLTVSAGARTSKMVCATCGKKAALWGGCDHPMGMDSKDNFNFIVTGSYVGNEVSIVTTPANDTSTVYSMVFDSDDQPENVDDFIIKDTIESDSVVENTIAEDKVVETLTEDRVSEIVASAIADALSKLEKEKIPTTVAGLPVVQLDGIDWSILSAWAKTLGLETKDDLAVESFIGAGSHLPVYDAESYAIVEKVIDNYSGIGKAELLLALHARKPAVAAVDDKLVEDYSLALQTIEKLENKLTSVLDFLAVANKKDISLVKTLDDKLAWFDTLETTQETEVQDIASPVVATQPVVAERKKMPTDFQKVIIQKYKREQAISQSAADKYLSNLKKDKKILADFNIEDYLS